MLFSSLSLSLFFSSVGRLLIEFSSQMTMERVQKENPNVTEGGRYTPPDCQPRWKVCRCIAICISQHLNKLYFTLYGKYILAEVSFCQYKNKRWDLVPDKVPETWTKSQWWGTKQKCWNRQNYEKLTQYNIPNLKWYRLLFHFFMRCWLRVRSLLWRRRIVWKLAEQYWNLNK